MTNIGHNMNIHAGLLCQYPTHHEYLTPAILTHTEDVMNIQLKFLINIQQQYSLPVHCASRMQASEKQQGLQGMRHCSDNYRSYWPTGPSSCGAAGAIAGRASNSALAVKSGNNKVMYQESRYMYFYLPLLMQPMTCLCPAMSSGLAPPLGPRPRK